MSTAFKTVALIGKYKSPGIAEPLEGLAKFLVAQHMEVLIEAETAKNISLRDYATVSGEEIGAQADLAIVVGGDGTMLSIARILAPFNVPLIGINQGRLGFMTDIALDEKLETLGEMLHGDFTEEDRLLLEGHVERSGVKMLDALALNDVVVSRGVIGGMIECRVRIDGQFVYDQRSDGLIIATPTGSTAYALSAAGPILHPSVAAFVLVPVSPHTLTNRPIAVSDRSVVEIVLTRGRDASAHFDGQSNFMLHENDKITVRRSKHVIRLLHPKGYDYFSMLRQKLHWSEFP